MLNWLRNLLDRYDKRPLTLLFELEYEEDTAPLVLIDWETQNRKGTKKWDS